MSGYPLCYLLCPITNADNAIIVRGIVSMRAIFKLRVFRRRPMRARLFFLYRVRRLLPSKQAALPVFSLGDSGKYHACLVVAFPANGAPCRVQAVRARRAVIGSPVLPLSMVFRAGDYVSVRNVRFFAKQTDGRACFREVL